MTAKIGRPSIKTPELCEEICALVVQGKAIASIGEMEGMPEARTIWMWLNRDEEFFLSYTRAIQARALIHAERIDELAEKAMRGEIPPDAARVAIDAKKWTAQRLLPKLYGEKQQVEATVTHTHTLHLEALKELANRARGNECGYIDAQVIDVAAIPAFQDERHGADRPAIEASGAERSTARPPRPAGGRGARARARHSPATDENRADPPPPTPSSRKTRPRKNIKNGSDA